MSRELGEKSRLILEALLAHGEPMDGDEVAAAIGDAEEGATLRVKALLRNLLGRGLVTQPGRGLWLATEEGTSAAPRRALNDTTEPDDGQPTQRRVDAQTTAALLKQQRLAPTADARARNSGPRGPRQAAARIKVATPKAAPLPIDAHEVAVSASGEVLVLSRDAVITRLSATVALQVAEAVRRLHQGA